MRRAEAQGGTGLRAAGIGVGTFEEPLALSSDVVFADNDGVSSILSMDDLLWKLPLFDDVYYSMQGQNVMLVDVYLRDVETDVRNEYYKLERTPVQSMMFLSAISQMWIFSVYELLRAWRQAVREIKKEAALVGPVAAEEPGDLSQLATASRRSSIERARTDPAFIEELDRAKDQVDQVFRRIEALRMNLAKHEIKGRKQLAIGPGYARLDESTGSLIWMVDLGDNNCDMFNRRDFADELRVAVIGHVLPEDDAEDYEETKPGEEA
jgi:hypothetical protein